MSVNRGQAKALYPPGLELQPVWAEMWVVGTKYVSSGRVASSLTHRASSIAQATGIFLTFIFLL